MHAVRFRKPPVIRVLRRPLPQTQDACPTASTALEATENLPIRMKPQAHRKNSSQQPYGSVVGSISEGRIGNSECSASSLVSIHFKAGMLANLDITVKAVVDQGDGLRLVDAHGRVEGTVLDMDALNSGSIEGALAAALEDHARAAADMKRAVGDPHELRPGTFDVLVPGREAIGDVVADERAVQVSLLLFSSERECC